METEGEARGERGGEYSKRRRTEDNSSGRIDDESATTEIEEEEEEAKTSEDKEGDIPTALDYMDEPWTEEDFMDSYRKGWEYMTQGRRGGFEDTTRLSSMLTTSEKSDRYAWVGTSLQVYYIKVLKTKLKWPLQVYGLVAARDRVDFNRNILFNRKRDNCQIITKKDPCLLLTGPSRAIEYLDPVNFEIELKVKGESEDKEALISQVLTYSGSTGPFGTRRSNHLCTIDLHFKELERTVQATMTSVRVIRGSWPCGFGGQVVFRDTSSPEEVVLLDFRHEVPMDPDGCFHLSRRVVSVGLDGGMTISVKAYSIIDDVKITVASGDIIFKPHKHDITKGKCYIGDDCQVEITVAWSLLHRRSYPHRFSSRLP